MSQKKLKRIKKENLVPKLIDSVRQFREGLGIFKIIKQSYIFLILMTVGIFLLYFNSLTGDFVSDDYASITLNNVVGNFSEMFHNGNSMTFGTYLIEKFFGHTSTFPFHLSSVLIYMAVCVLFYIFLEVVFENRKLSMLTMVLFAAAPIHVESVSWISGRIYLILAFYIILGLLGFVGFLKTDKKRYLIITLVTFVLAFLTDKPRPFAMLLLIGLYVLYWGVEKVKESWWKVIGAFFVAGVIFVMVAWPNIMNRINVVNSGYNTSESIFYNPFYQYPTGVSKYLQLLWFPVDLTLYHTMYVFPGWLNWAIILTYILAVVYFFFKNKPYFFALGFIMAATLPSIMPVKVSWLVAERYVFLGSLGFYLFLALFLTDLQKRFKLVMPVLLGCILVYSTIRVISRNYDWQTNHNLWVNTCQISPNSHNAWNNIGDDYDKLKEYNNAIKGFTQSTLVKPNYADAYHNRANIFFKMGRLDLARESYGVALNFSPNLYQTYISLCQIDLNEKRYDLALAHAQGALKIDPRNPQAAYIAAVTYAQMNDFASAKAILTEIIKTNPQFELARTALSQLSTMEAATKK